MSWNVDALPAETLKLLSIEGLGVTTLSTLASEVGDFRDIGPMVNDGSIDSLLPDGTCQMLRQRMIGQNEPSLRFSAESAHAQLVTTEDESFPLLLRSLPACPAVLWYCGNLDVANTAGVAIVGSRRCTSYGKEQAMFFAQEIASSNLTVFSGGARGIDAIAHMTALQCGGHTVAILGSGLLHPYPPEHANLFDQIIQKGGLLMSEFSCDKTPLPENFPRRNRIVAGLASVVLVVEAAKRSGALITARIAVEEHGRDVYVVPGRLGDPVSAGCLHVLHEGWAHVAISPEEIVQVAENSYDRFSRV